MIVELRPIEKKRWHGLPIEATFGADQKINATISARTGKYNVALTEEELTELQGRLGYDLSLNMLPNNQPHPFWDSSAGTVTLPTSTTFFNTDVPLDKLKVAIMKGHPQVCNNKNEVSTNPGATHFIYSEEEEVVAKQVNVSAKRKAFAALDTMTTDEKVAMLILLTGKTDYKKKSNDFIDTALFEKVDAKPTEFLNYKKDAKEFILVFATVRTAIAKGIISKDGPRFQYGESILGFEEREVVTYLAQDINQPLLMKIRELCD